MQEDWVLCRVFHRSKESSDNINGSGVDLSHRFMLEKAAFSPPSSDNLAPMPYGCISSQNNPNPLLCSSTSTLYQDNPRNNNDNSSSNDSNISPFHLLHHPLDVNSSNMSPKVVDDTYGFFWGDGVPSSSCDTSGMRIDLDDDGLVFH